MLTLHSKEKNAYALHLIRLTETSGIGTLLLNHQHTPAGFTSVSSVLYQDGITVLTDPGSKLPTNHFILDLLTPTIKAQVDAAIRNAEPAFAVPDTGAATIMRCNDQLLNDGTYALDITLPNPATQVPNIHVRFNLATPDTIDINGPYSGGYHGPLSRWQDLPTSPPLHAHYVQTLTDLSAHQQTPNPQWGDLNNVIQELRRLRAFSVAWDHRAQLKQQAQLLSHLHATTQQQLRALDLEHN